MTATHAAEYVPTDRLYLRLLTRPQQPMHVGELNLVRTTQGVSLHYAESWLRDGFPLSEDLPLIDEEFLPIDKGSSSMILRSPRRSSRACSERMPLPGS